MKIRKFCSRCSVQIDYHSESFYLQIFQRELMSNRDTAFLCKNCCKKFIIFMEGSK